MMSDDLSSLLRQWPYDPERISVRLIRGEEGHDKLQLRVDLGVLQMEADGRPDGERPEGCESWLDYYERQQRAYDAAHPDSPTYQLGEDDCLRLWREGVQYYHRYLSYWHLQLYDRCARDTARNLRLFAFVRAHVREDRVRLQFDQFRPYVLMMHARAVATPLLEANRYDEGLEAIEAGIDAIREFLEEYQQSEAAGECVELVNLEQWREEILGKTEVLAAAPRRAIEALRSRLNAAIAAEDFEEAARLRDEIRRLTSQP